MKNENINPEYVARVRELIGERLRDFREERGMTQQELADQLGISNCTVSKIEAGRWLSLEMLIKVCATLGCYFFLCPNDSNDDLATVMRHRYAIMRNAGKSPS